MLKWEKERQRKERWIRSLTEYQSVHFGGFSQNSHIGKMNTMTSFRRSHSKQHLGTRKVSADHAKKKPKTS